MRMAQHSTSTISASTVCSNSALRLAGWLLTAVACACALSACGGGDKKKGATQVAAKVNKEEISVHQINYVLQRQGNVPADQVPAISKRILDSLIDQELAIQQASEEKIDRDPKVVMAIEAAKREIIARAYADRIADTAAKPTPDEIKAYYTSKPALFANRKIYNLMEFSVESDAAARTAIAPKLQAARNADEVGNLLKAAGLHTASRQITQGAENLPLGMVDQIATLHDGQSLATGTAQGFSVLTLVSAKAAPVTEDTAKPAIEQFLQNDRKRKVVDDTVKKLRAAAKISYEGQFADSAASAPATTAAASK
jgi:EpsD family peptidyl-prolyl cis-trans isomerase